MALLNRILRRGSRVARDLSDIPLRRKYIAQRRPKRTASPLDDMLSRSTLVIMAHPDDEIIAAGALLRHVPHAGVVYVTNGAPLKERYSRQAGFNDWLNYAAARRRESEVALALLDRELAPSQWLGISDQEAIFHLVAVSRYLAKHMTGFHQVITHAYEGGHPDHDATAFCVHAATALMMRACTTPPPIIEAPLYSGTKKSYVHQIFVPHPDAGPPLVLPLSAQEQDTKRRMFKCHATQGHTFDDFQVELEQFRLAPRYHFAAPPLSGEVGYHDFGWPVNGHGWRREAWKALRELDLLDELA